MDQVKIGQFIQTLRKEKGLTQKDLADRIGVSDKAVSKWENGRGMPDTALLTPICRELDVSINELLTAECISSEDFSENAEKTILELYKRNKDKKGYVIPIIVGSVLAVLSIIYLISIVSTGIIEAAHRLWSPKSMIFLLLICTATVFISHARGIRQVLRAIKRSVIPAGILLALAGFIHILKEIDVYKSESISDLSWNWQVVNGSSASNIIVLIYAFAIYLIVAVWITALDNKREK